MSGRMQARFENGVYRDCRWCRGSGCLSCPAEADKEYKRQFPDGPKPILSISREDIEHFKVSEMTGGPSIADAHGGLGRLIEAVNDMFPPHKPNKEPK